ncbi:hypothetical protein M1D93_14815 [Arthrobacter sp. Z1-9]
MAATLDANRLKSISITGKTLEADLVESCTKASFGASTSQVTEMSLTFLDSMDLETFRSGLLESGASVNYGGWNMITRGLSLKSGSAGPELTVKCPSIFVERLRDQTGGYSWADRDRHDFRGVPIRVVSSPGDTGVLQPSTQTSSSPGCPGTTRSAADTQRATTATPRTTTAPTSLRHSRRGRVTRSAPSPRCWPTGTLPSWHWLTVPPSHPGHPQRAA